MKGRPKGKFTLCILLLYKTKYVVPKVNKNYFTTPFLCNVLPVTNVVQMRFLVLVLWNKWWKYYHPFKLTNNLSNCFQCMCERWSKSFHHVKYIYSSNHKLFRYRHYIEHFWKLIFSITDSLETKINLCIYIYIMLSYLSY
jgi:hypothetical protein